MTNSRPSTITLIPHVSLVPRLLPHMGNHHPNDRRHQLLPHPLFQIPSRLTFPELPTVPSMLASTRLGYPMRATVASLLPLIFLALTSPSSRSKFSLSHLHLLFDSQRQIWTAVLPRSTIHPELCFIRPLRLVSLPSLVTPVPLHLAASTMNVLHWKTKRHVDQPIRNFSAFASCCLPTLVPATRFLTLSTGVHFHLNKISSLGSPVIMLVAKS
jgi:hypothetical protein